jgi:hypothetical protein
MKKLLLMATGAAMAIAGLGALVSMHKNKVLDFHNDNLSEMSKDTGTDSKLICLVRDGINGLDEDDIDKCVEDLLGSPNYSVAILVSALLKHRRSYQEDNDDIDQVLKDIKK